MRFFFGAMSPYSWLAAERIDDPLPGAEWRPIFLGGVFKAVDRTSWGLTEARAAKQADCEARAAARGLGPIRWPERWPTNDLTAARAMVFARERGMLKQFALTAMRLEFLEAGDLGELSVVQGAGERAGLDREELAEAVASTEIKDRLRAETDEAVALGVIGVPTVEVNGELFWGDDRLEEAAAAGRTPRASA